MCYKEIKDDVTSILMCDKEILMCYKEILMCSKEILMCSKESYFAEKNGFLCLSLAYLDSFVLILFNFQYKCSFSS